MATTATPGGLFAFFRNLRDSVLALRHAPPTLWAIFLVQFLENVAYFSVYDVMAVYLREDLGFDDMGAGAIVGVWGMTISVMMFFSGFICDWIGIRKNLLFGVTSCFAGRLAIALVHDPTVAVAGLFAMTWGVSSMTPTMTAAIRKYTTKDTVSFGFSVFYVVMNLGAAAAPLTIQTSRKLLAEPLRFEGLGWYVTSSQAVFWLGVFTTLLSVITIALAIPGEPPAPAGERRRNPVSIAWEVISEKAFWRFLLFVGLLVLVRLVFQHAHITWPTYSMREFGKDFPWAGYWTINPFMIILITPVVTMATARWSAYRAIVLGALVTSVAVSFMAFSTTVAASVAFIVVLSLGEAMWSPRLYEYTATIAPKGREASYMGLSQVPMFFAKFGVGFLSGALLGTYCPPTGERNSHLMWGIVAAMTVAGPLLILLLRPVIQPKATAETPPAAIAGA
jgi:dipeptide/tripeptide permease